MTRLEERQQQHERRERRALAQHLDVAAEPVEGEQSQRTVAEHLIRHIGIADREVQARQRS